MGEPQEERLIWLHNEQAITSPEWSNPTLLPEPATILSFGVWAVKT